MNQEKTNLTCVLFGAALAIVACAAVARAGGLRIAGSPEYDWATGTGFRVEEASGPGWCVNNSGTAVGYATKYVDGADMGQRAVRWDASGTAIELENLGVNDSGLTNCRRFFAINDAGTAVGAVAKFVDGTALGFRPVRWDASGAVTELDHLGARDSGESNSTVFDVNSAGTTVGNVYKYVGGIPKGDWAVRWDAGNTAATELGHLGTDSGGKTYCYAYAVNGAGTAVGRAEKFVGGTSVGDRAVRWDAAGTAATELGNLGTDANGKTDSYANAINDAATVVGFAVKYVGGVNLGTRAVRWDAEGTAAVELGHLGTDGSGRTYADAFAVNATGTAVGYAQKYVGGAYVGYRAVRWDAGGTVATELDNLGADSSGYTLDYAWSLNGAGTAVGYAAKYVDGVNVGDHAVIWLPDARAIDLNDLGAAPVPDGGSWTLTEARGLSADGWVAGRGLFDPDGAGPLAAYRRLWVTQAGLGGTWTNAAGGTWGRGPNWSTGTPAMQVGDATFDLDAAYTITLDRDELTKTIAVEAGTVTIDFAGQALSTESGMTIAKGATLKGNGTIVSDVLNSGTVAVGNGPAVLTVHGNLISAGTLEMGIAGLMSHDVVHVTGEFTAGGTIAVELMEDYAPLLGDTFNLMSFDSFIDGGYTFDFSEAELSPGLAWDTSGFAATGTVSVVPEPISWVLLLAGAACAAWWRRRRAY